MKKMLNIFLFLIAELTKASANFPLFNLEDSLIKNCQYYALHYWQIEQENVS